MRILLVQPASNIMKNRKEGKPALQPLGLAYIAGTLIDGGYKNVKILDALAEGYYNETPFKKDYIRYGLSPDEIKKRIKEFNPDVVGVSCICNLRQYQALEICELAKEVNENIVTVIGGNPITIEPKWFLKREYLDFAVLGEGEQPFLELVQSIKLGNPNIWLTEDISKINGIAYKVHSSQPDFKTKYVINPQKVWRKDMDNIPFPAHHLLPLDKHLEIWNKEGYHYYPARKFTSMVMSRGCPNKCEHCPHSVVFPGYRPRSAKNIFKEVKMVHEQLGVVEIQFHEYNGIVVWSIVEEFCKLMIDSGLNKKVSWGWPIGIWLKVLNYDRLKLMRESGMFYVDLAIESSNQKILNNLMKGKDVDLSHTMNVIKWSRELGYYINCFFMLGLEGQTKKDIEDTITFSSKLDVDTIAYFIAQPLPGTPFWDHCVEKKLFNDDFETFHLRYGKSNIEVEGITSEELEHYRHKAREDFVNYWKKHGRKPYAGKRGTDFLLKRGCE